MVFARVLSCTEGNEQPHEPQHPVKVRCYTQAPGTAYFLPSDEEEAQRLRKQHALLTRTLGGLIQAPVTLTTEDRVLDNGTGTGIWVLEAAKMYPEVTQFHGIDIEPRLFPDPSLVPHNVNFQVQSILKLPADWTNSFAFVHQRLLICALRKHEWPQALKEIHRVLQPGGWVQLTEAENWVAGPVTKTFCDILGKVGLFHGTERWPGLILVLKRYLEECGFVNLCIMPHNTPMGIWAGEDGRISKDNVVAIFQGVRPRVLECGGFGPVDDNVMFNDLLVRFEEEVDSVRDGRIEWFVAYAQKSARERS